MMLLAARPDGSPHAGAVPPMVKFVLEISKKIFPTAATLILHCEDRLLGTVIAWEPSFGVLPMSVIGKLFPPSVDNKIATLAQFTGERFVLLTLQLTVCVDPTGHDTAVFGAVTAKGPALPLTVTSTSSLLLLAPPALLSLTVKRKLSDRATDGRTSHL